MAQTNGPGSAPVPTRRADRALATRRRMVQAASDMFATEGYTGTTMAAVAKRADVAVPTVYYTFGTKSALLAEALGAAIVGIDRWREPPPEPFDLVELLPVHRWWGDLLTAPTAAEALSVFVSHGTDILRRVGPLMPALHGSSGDRESPDLVQVNEERRAQSYLEVVKHLCAKPAGLRDGLDVEKATDIVVVLFSPEVYQGLVGRGWSHEDCATFFEDSLARLVLRPVTSESEHLDVRPGRSRS
jgi:AcrR family transcriptional regulator